MRSYIFTNELIEKFHTPVCTNVGSAPKIFVDIDHDQFLITAEPTEEYIKLLSEGKAGNNRQGSNFRPVFFVYESDSLAVENQLKMMKNLLDGPYKDCVFSITKSGSKSVHTLVYIGEKYRDFVKKDFHFYWSYTAKILFGDDAQFLDKSCASIGRLSRLPGGTRDNGIVQTCIYMNEDPVSVNLDQIVEQHEQQLLIQSYIRAMKPKKVYDEKELTEEEEMKKLENMRKVSVSAPFNLAFEVIKNDYTPAGENYIGALRSLKARGFSEDFVRTHFFDKVQRAHKSNMPAKFEHYWR